MTYDQITRMSRSELDLLARSIGAEARDRINAIECLMARRSADPEHVTLHAQLTTILEAAA